MPCAASNGPVIAVDVARDLAITAMAGDMHEASLFSRLVRPPLVSILIRARTVASRFEDRQQSPMPTSPSCPRSGRRHRERRAFDDAVAVGYRAAQLVLETQEAKTLLKNLRGR